MNDEPYIDLRETLYPMRPEIEYDNAGTWGCRSEPPQNMHLLSVGPNAPQYVTFRYDARARRREHMWRMNHRPEIEDHAAALADD